MQLLPWGLLRAQQILTADGTGSALQSLAWRASSQASALPAPGSVPVEILHEDAKVALAWRSEAHSLISSNTFGASSLKRRMKVTQVGPPVSGLHLQCLQACCLLAGA
jgi:hypothetical protein